MAKFGDQTLKEQPDSPKTIENASQKVVILHYKSQDYDSAYAARPALGTAGYGGWGGEYRVAQVEVSREETNWADIVVRIETPIFSDFTIGVLPDTIEQIEWYPHQKDIRLHWIFQAGGPHALTADNLKTLKLYLEGEDLRATPAANIQKAYDFIVGGDENYTEYLPLIRRTDYAAILPVVSGCGILQNPVVSFQYPTTDAIGRPYKYVKVADTRVRTRLYWERTREWLGHVSINSQLYT